MENREAAMAMAAGGSASSFYMHRGEGFSNPRGGWPQGFNASSFTAPIQTMPMMHHSSDITGGVVATTGPTTSAIHGDPPPSAISQHASPATAPQTGEPVKKKRGRPRKYVQDANTTAVSLVLSPLSSPPQNPDSSPTPTHKRGRGRPPGSGKKQQLAYHG